MIAKKDRALLGDLLTQAHESLSEAREAFSATWASKGVAALRETDQYLQAAINALAAAK